VSKSVILERKPKKKEESSVSDLRITGRASNSSDVVREIMAVE